jgi:hypothetical protein
MRRAAWAITMAAVSAALCLVTGWSQETPQPLKLVQRVPMPNVVGRIDHLSVDVKGKRLFLAGLDNSTVEVIDIGAGKRLHTISGLKDPQGVLYVADTNRLFVADGALNLVNMYDGTTYRLLHTEPGMPNADNLRYAGILRTYGTGLVFVGYGHGNKSALRAMDSETGDPMYEIVLDGHPESFQMDGRYIFINVPTAGAVELAAGRRVTMKWPIEGFKPFYPMALDVKDQRIFIGSRNPDALVVLDMKTGGIVTSVPGVAHTDDLWYDAARKRIYMSGGDGEIGVFEQLDADHYRLIAKIPSVPGASTSFFVPDFSRLYVPASAYAGQPAQLLIYQAQP